MARTAKTQRLTALEVRHYANDTNTTTPLHDGGGLYLRKRAPALHWYLRLTDPATSSEQGHRMFPDDPLGVYPHKSLMDARAEAKRLWGQRSSGLDLRAERLKKIRLDRQAEADARQAAERRQTVRKVFDRGRAIDLAPRVATDGRRRGRKDGGDFVSAQFEKRVFVLPSDLKQLFRFASSREPRREDSFAGMRPH